jgi:acetyl-CoA acyltransferase
MTLVPMGGVRYLPNPRMAAEQPGTYLNMGLTAERLAVRDKVSREDQDRFALASHRKALAASAEGRFADELVPVTSKSPSRGPKGSPSSRRSSSTATRGLARTRRTRRSPS